VFTPTQGVVPAAPPTYGLVASAARPNIDRWEGGLAWVPERCGAQYRLVPLCDQPDDEFTPDRPGAVYYRPVGLDVADECSTMSGPLDEARFRRVADAMFPFAVARELWDGAGTKADPYSEDGQTTNAYLASPAATTVGGSAASAVKALGRLEQAALEASRGQTVMLHVPPVLAWQLVPNLFRVGQQLLTSVGNTVVVDAGYPGTGPSGQAAGATVWAYASAPVAVLASSWQFITDDPQTVDRSINTRTAWASRLIAATWDPCVHLATEVTL
jgi:hypothetical protein